MWLGWSCALSADLGAKAMGPMLPLPLCPRCSSLVLAKAGGCKEGTMLGSGRAVLGRPADVLAWEGSRPAPIRATPSPQICPCCLEAEKQKWPFWTPILTFWGLQGQGDSEGHWNVIRAKLVCPNLRIWLSAGFGICRDSRNGTPKDAKKQLYIFWETQGCHWKWQLCLQCSWGIGSKCQAGEHVQEAIPRWQQQWEWPWLQSSFG